MALHHRPVFADKKVIICALYCFIQFVVYSMRNPFVYRTAKKVVFFANYFANYLSWYECLNRLKLREVSLLNKRSKICVILNLDSLQCFYRPLTYCPASDKGF